MRTGTIIGGAVAAVVVGLGVLGWNLGLLHHLNVVEAYKSEVAGEAVHKPHRLGATPGTYPNNGNNNADGSIPVRVVSGGGGTVTNSTSAVSGGVASFSRIPSSAASTNATVAKASAGRVYKVYACNTTTTAKFIRFYNVATSPTVGTTAVAFSRALPGSPVAGVPLCQSFDQEAFGWFFSTGIAYALTTGNPDADTGALASGDVTQISVEYQ